MTKGVIGSVIRPGATTAAVWRRRRKMRSAIVPSLLSSFVAGGLSLPSPGGSDGAMFSVASVSFMSMSSRTSVGADVGRYAAGGGAGDVGGACDVRPGKDVSMKRAWGET
eukprot:6191564-Pleurochrysis_carterae.AAC.1